MVEGQGKLILHIVVCGGPQVTSVMLMVMECRRWTHSMRSSLVDVMRSVLLTMHTLVVDRLMGIPCWEQARVRDWKSMMTAVSTGVQLPRKNSGRPEAGHTPTQIQLSNSQTHHYEVAGVMMVKMNVNWEVSYYVTGGAWGCRAKVFLNYFFVCWRSMWEFGIC
jgi:hypothetical protein